MSNPATHELEVTGEERRWRRETRSAWLRLVALAILAVNLMAVGHVDSVLVYSNVIAGYGLLTGLGLAISMARRGPAWISTFFVVTDAILVIALFHEHLFAPGETADHGLSLPTLAIGFLLLTHVALRLEPWLVLLFSSLVIVAWLSLLVLTAVQRPWTAHSPYEHLWSALSTDVALAASFGFAAFVCYLLTRDHNVLLSEAVTSERRRQNLARFFPPNVQVELQSKSVSFNLDRRRAAVMFVDLRHFTSFSETRSPEDVAELLAGYRQLVTEVVFNSGGTVDKFIGDGVMAVFGHPQTADDDTARALRCALQLKDALARWKAARIQDSKPALDAGIGLHVGPVVAGVLRSGSHDEFTVVGDTVNVASRLDRLAGRIGASLVVSEAVIQEVASSVEDASWSWEEAAKLDGRSGTLRIAYIAQACDETTK